MTKKKLAAASPPTGNVFEYYVPKTPKAHASTATGTATKVKPAPTTPTTSTAGKTKHPKPGKFIKDNFERTDKANFGTSGPLGGTSYVIQDIEVIRAALECGYGRRSNWTAALALNPHEATDLARYLLLRLQMVTSCLHFDGNQAKLPRSFYSRVEASEKVALSFIVGSIGTYLAARRWLRAGGDSVEVFLHVGIYTKAINGAAPLVTFPSTSGKAPDYLVASRNGDWHIFESKGGKANGRWARIVEGLVQLANLPPVGWAGKSASQATTCVCVHTSVDPNRTLHVTAVDPPGDGMAGPDRQSLMVLEGVCKLLLLLETLEQYRALVDNIAPRGDQGVASADWTIGTSSQFGGLIVGVPTRYLRREFAVRRRLAVFLAIGEVVGRPAFDKAKEDKGAVLIDLVERELSTHVPADKPWVIHPRLLRRIVNRIVSHLGKEDFLSCCSDQLELNRLALQLMPVDKENVFLRLTQNLPYLVTSGGMLLQRITPNAPPFDNAATSLRRLPS